MTSKYSPKVSVIIITYNQEAFISDTLDSVLVQNYPNLEIVVADDASTDNTPMIIEQYHEKYPEIIRPVLNPNNLGITGNSNAAFFHCTGELIAILGGDDIFLPGKIEKQVRQFEDPKVVLSYHQVDIFLHQTGETLFVTNTTEREFIGNAYDIISKGGIPGASSVMVRRSACPEHGFDPQFPVVSDWIFYIEVALKGKVAFLNEMLGRYRKHGKGASERTLELMSESLMTLDVVIERYGKNDRHLINVCKKGKRRYILGEVYRQIILNKTENMPYLFKLLQQNNNGIEICFMKFFGIILSNKSIVTYLSLVLPKLKNFIKRNIL
ncbi:glycosyltransferase [Citrobacter sp. Cpo142]|jgi:glycosyltransferase involved in cell wall biosynthesis|uniref:glycosyltransferase family 2 protein n=1 Tax=Citrobacter TaxID=544 RepID=UPI00257585F3|nr:glycosyltransferase [Citrobacter sp. Cpo142]MDM2776598.1 glycosyltransferase [Citrobacter sp. Cpo142]